MRHEFRNNDIIQIERAAPTSVRSTTTVQGVEGTVSGVTVEFDILHTFTSDLVITLRSPDGRGVTLVNREGGSGNHFFDTVFDDRSSSSIVNARPPFTGRFRPDEPLRGLDGVEANGQWTLEIDDTEAQDGGFLVGWSLGLTVQRETVSGFSIDVDFVDGLSMSQQRVFSAAADRWSEIIKGASDGSQLKLVIRAEGREIDGGGVPGQGNILGQAGPREFHSNGLPSHGIMEFDTFDLDRMENDGSLVNVIIHEMAHVVGHGTTWRRRGLLVGAGSFNPRFVGMQAMQQFGALLGTNRPTAVPVANRGGPGTRDGHWRETTFGRELLTGRLNPGVNPISRLSIASLADLGYRVDLDAADAFELADPRVLSLLGTEGEGSWCCACGHH